MPDRPDEEYEEADKIAQKTLEQVDSDYHAVDRLIVAKEIARLRDAEDHLRELVEGYFENDSVSFGESPYSDGVEGLYEFIGDRYRVHDLKIVKRIVDELAGDLIPGDAE